jgi:hypothetical protein
LKRKTFPKEGEKKLKETMQKLKARIKYLEKKVKYYENQAMHMMNNTQKKHPKDKRTDAEKISDWKKQFYKDFRESLKKK